MAELKKCPFCGGDAEVVQHNTYKRDWTPRCKQTSCCGRLQKKFAYKELAIKFWNRRTEDGK